MKKVLGGIFLCFMLGSCALIKEGNHSATFEKFDKRLPAEQTFKSPSDPTEFRNR